jgi:hypothetical protein
MVLLLVACTHVEQAREKADDPDLVGAPDEAVPDPGAPDDPGDETVEPVQDPFEPFPGEERGDFLYAEGVVHDFEIELRDAAVESLESDPKTYVPATFTWNGETFYPGVRLKGSSTFRTLDQKAAFKIDFHEYDPDARFHGVKRLTLNAMVSDGTMMREHAYYGYAARLGVPAPRHGYARVTVNGEWFGLYGIVETMDEQFVNRVWPDDDGGVLYESSGQDLTWSAGHLDVDEAGEGDLDALIDALESAADGAFLSTLEREFDADALFAYLAMDLAGGNDDGYARNRHNYHLYYAPDAGRWSMIPWGTDRSFEDHCSVYGDPTKDEWPGMIKTRCLAVADCRARLEDAIRDVADGWDSRGLTTDLVSTADVIRADCEADPRREHGCDPDGLIDYLDDRAAEVRAELP